MRFVCLGQWFLEKKCLVLFIFMECLLSSFENVLYNNLVVFPFVFSKKKIMPFPEDRAVSEVWKNPRSSWNFHIWIYLLRRVYFISVLRDLGRTAAQFKTAEENKTPVYSGPSNLVIFYTSTLSIEGIWKLLFPHLNPFSPVKILVSLFLKQFPTLVNGD